MFILRKITGQDVQINIALGDSYNLIDKELNPSDFEACAKVHGDVPVTAYAFITTEGGKRFIPLYLRQHNYIMTESGKTFANISKK